MKSADVLRSSIIGNRIEASNQVEVLSTMDYNDFCIPENFQKYELRG
jgi:hypothetical protein